MNTTGESPKRAVMSLVINNREAVYNPLIDQRQLEAPLDDVEVCGWVAGERGACHPLGIVAFYEETDRDTGIQRQYSFMADGTIYFCETQIGNDKHLIEQEDLDSEARHELATRIQEVAFDLAC